jgi:hypothetical protein
LGFDGVVDFKVVQSFWFSLDKDIIPRPIQALVPAISEAFLVFGEGVPAEALPEAFTQAVVTETDLA